MFRDPTRCRRFDYCTVRGRSVDDVAESCWTSNIEQHRMLYDEVHRGGAALACSVFFFAFVMRCFLCAAKCQGWFGFCNVEVAEYTMSLALLVIANRTSWWDASSRCILRCSLIFCLLTGNLSVLAGLFSLTLSLMPNRFTVFTVTVCAMSAFHRQWMRRQRCFEGFLFTICVRREMFRS